MSDGIENALQRQVLAANLARQPLNIVGGGSKSFYGRAASGTPIRTGAHAGVLHYDPAELVITARAGTPIAEVEELLDSENQMLGFEPPRFSAAATLGGTVAAGLAGPRRPFAGAVRDFVLGVRMLNGKGDIMRFGGEVMKNVAGFDIARLMAGALGVLGILLEISLRVVPRPQVEKTLLSRQPDAATAIDWFNRLAGRPLPLSAAAWWDGLARIRLSGSAAGVDAAARAIGGEDDPHGGEFWQQLRDHELPFFRAELPLLRVSVPPAAALDADALGAPQLVDWGGAQRWIFGDGDGGGGDGSDALRTAVAEHGGHVTHFRHGDRHGAVFHPLATEMHALHRRLKHAFDPAGILNPSRLYRDW